jgi:hypothetical protein
MCSDHRLTTDLRFRVVGFIAERIGGCQPYSPARVNPGIRVIYRTDTKLGESYALIRRGTSQCVDRILVN